MSLGRKSYKRLTASHSPVRNSPKLSPYVSPVYSPKTPERDSLFSPLRREPGNYSTSPGRPKGDVSPRFMEFLQRSRHLPTPGDIPPQETQESSTDSFNEVLYSMDDPGYPVDASGRPMFYTDYSYLRTFGFSDEPKLEHKLQKLELETPYTQLEILKKFFVDNYDASIEYPLMVNELRNILETNFLDFANRTDVTPYEIFTEIRDRMFTLIVTVDHLRQNLPEPPTRTHWEFANKIEEHRFNVVKMLAYYRKRLTKAVESEKKWELRARSLRLLADKYHARSVACEEKVAGCDPKVAAELEKAKEDAAHFKSFSRTLAGLLQQEWHKNSKLTNDLAEAREAIILSEENCIKDINQLFQHTKFIKSLETNLLIMVREYFQNKPGIFADESDVENVIDSFAMTWITKMKQVIHRRALDIGRVKSQLEYGESDYALLQKELELAQSIESDMEEALRDYKEIADLLDTHTRMKAQEVEEKSKMCDEVDNDLEIVNGVLFQKQLAVEKLKERIAQTEDEYAEIEAGYFVNRGTSPVKPARPIAIPKRFEASRWMFRERASAGTSPMSALTASAGTSPMAALTASAGTSPMVRMSPAAAATSDRIPSFQTAKFLKSLEANLLIMIREYFQNEPGIFAAREDVPDVIEVFLFKWMTKIKLVIDNRILDIGRLNSELQEAESDYAALQRELELAKSIESDLEEVLRDYKESADILDARIKLLKEEEEVKSKECRDCDFDLDIVKTVLFQKQLAVEKLKERIAQIEDEYAEIEADYFVTRGTSPAKPARPIAIPKRRVRFETSRWMPRERASVATSPMAAASTLSAGTSPMVTSVGRAGGRTSPAAAARLSPTSPSGRISPFITGTGTGPSLAWDSAHDFGNITPAAAARILPTSPSSRKSPFIAGTGTGPSLDWDYGDFENILDENMDFSPVPSFSATASSGDLSNIFEEQMNLPGDRMEYSPSQMVTPEMNLGRSFGPSTLPGSPEIESDINDSGEDSMSGVRSINRRLSYISPNSPTNPYVNVKFDRLRPETVAQTLDFSDPSFRENSQPQASYMEVLDNDPVTVNGETVISKTLRLHSPTRPEPVTVNIQVSPKPLVETASGEHIVCDVSLDMNPGSSTGAAQAAAYTVDDYLRDSDHDTLIASRGKMSPFTIANAHRRNRQSYTNDLIRIDNAVYKAEQEEKLRRAYRRFGRTREEIMASPFMMQHFLFRPLSPPGSINIFDYMRSDNYDAWRVRDLAPLLRSYERK